MKSLAVLLVVALVLGIADARCSMKRPKADKMPWVVTTPQPHEYVKQSDIPDSFDWRNMEGMNYCSSSVNQHIPNFCESCWVLASTSALADRIRIARRSAFPDFMLAAQSILHCVPNGCLDGDSDDVHAHIYKHGIPVETCQNYVAIGTGQSCTAENTCMNCGPDGNCSSVAKYPRFYISEFGGLNGVEKMKAEIYKRGPISCQVASPPIFKWGLGPNRTDIFTGGEGYTHPDHEVSVVGFGVEGELPYWIIRNSWGEYWGENGFFRLEMGRNLIGLESNECVWSVPIIPDNLKP